MAVDFPQGLNKAANTGADRRRIGRQIMDLTEVFDRRQGEDKPPQGDNQKTEPGRPGRQSILHAAADDEPDDQEKGNDAADIAVAVAPGRNQCPCAPSLVTSGRKAS